MEVLINNELENVDISGYEKLITNGFKIGSTIENLQGLLEVSVSFVDNASIQLLNREYRGIDSPTDVLSFPQDDDGELGDLEGIPRILGDIVISLERAKEQAEDFGHSVQREVLYLAIHGFFHLLGYDHESPEDQSKMREMEERVLGELDLRRD